MGAGSIIAIITLLVAVVAQWLTMRQVERSRRIVYQELEDAISLTFVQQKRIKELTVALARQIDECNAANVRAAKAARSVEALPKLEINEEVGAAIWGPYYLN